MTLASDHIVGSFDGELGRLRDSITEMGGLAEAQLESAIVALARRDATLADQTRRGDVEIDAREREIDTAAVRLLALRQPMAIDLRQIVSALKIASDIERIGDYAANIAKRAIVLCDSPPVQPARSIPLMGELVQRILHDVLDAYADADAEAALAVWRADEEIDALYTGLFRELLTYMMEDPRTITPCTHLLFIAKNLERIGDHATNIAETLYYQVRGDVLPAARPKQDRSSFESVEPPIPAGDEDA